MPTIYSYILALFSNWFLNIIWFILGLAMATYDYFGRRPKHPLWFAYVGILLLAIFIAGYLEWGKQYKLGHPLCQKTDLREILFIKSPSDLKVDNESDIFLFDQLSTSSISDDYPYAKQIFIKTTQRLSPVGILIHYTGGPVKSPAHIDWNWVGKNNRLLVSNEKICVRSNKSLLISHRGEFFPKVPMFITIYSRNEIVINKIERAVYDWYSNN